MQTERYNFIRKELVKLHELFTQRTFNVYVSLSSFLTYEQLTNYEKHPPIGGFNRIEIVDERPYTIEYLLTMFEIMGDKAEMGFKYPKQDIPVMYDAAQNWIKYWVELKTSVGYLRTPPLEELEVMERLARYVFSAYKHYYYEKMNDNLNVPSKDNMTLFDVFKGRMMYGDSFDQDLSFISYLDQFRGGGGYIELMEGPGYNNGFSGFDSPNSGFGGGM